MLQGRFSRGSTRPGRLLFVCLGRRCLQGVGVSWWVGCGELGGYVPPVTRMTLPSRLPMSRAGSKLFPMPIDVIQSLSSGIMKP